MKEKTKIRIRFNNENEASSAYPYVEGMITCFYLFNKGFFLNQDAAVRDDPFQLFVMNYNEVIEDYDKDKLLDEYPDCALQYLSREGAEIVLEQCVQIQGPVPDLQMQSREGFFNSLCFILALIFPLKPFRVVCRHTKTDLDSAFVQETRAEYDTIVMHFYQFEGDPGNRVTADWMIYPKCVSNK